jgi:hypothetical protein
MEERRYRSKDFNHNINPKITKNTVDEGGKNQRQLLEGDKEHKNKGCGDLDPNRLDRCMEFIHYLQAKEIVKNMGTRKGK